jgi:CheY-like chemotaxis protein
MMPEMDGFEFIDELRLHPDWHAIPVVVVTAMNLTPEERLRLDGYIEQVVTKGAYTPEQLMQQIRQAVVRYTG